MEGFVVLPRRWVVERTFSWFGRNRRLAKDFENLAETLGAFVALASIQLALRRLARAQITANLHRTMVKVCKSDCEGTITGTHDDGEVAPIPAVGRAAMEPARFERSWRLPEGREIELLDGLERTIMSRD
jgi:hypothetical protein